MSTRSAVLKSEATVERPHEKDIWMLRSLKE